MGLKLAKPYKLTADLAKKARLLSLSGDTTRLRILCFMFQHRDPCVSEIAANLEMSIAAVSHHLVVLHKSGLLSSQRQGNNICYSLAVSRFTKDLKNLLCH